MEGSHIFHIKRSLLLTSFIIIVHFSKVIDQDWHILLLSKVYTYLIQFSLIFILNFFLFSGSHPVYHITFKFFLSMMPSQIFLVFECFLLNFNNCHMSINFSSINIFFKYKCNTVSKVFFFFFFCRGVFRLIFSFPPTPLLHLSWKDWLMISNSECEKSLLSERHQ